MQGVFWGYLFFFGMCVGGIIGCILYEISVKTGNTEKKIPQYRPSKEEIKIVLQVIMMSLRYSPHEKECVAEALRLIELMPEDEEDE